MIFVKGGSASQRKHVPSVVNFCIQKLMPRMSGLNITVHLKDLKGDAYGYCLADDDESRLDRPRSFEIEIHKNMSLRKVLETLCHEMVHVSQYAKGRLAVNGKMDYKTQEEYEKEINKFKGKYSVYLQ